MDSLFKHVLVALSWLSRLMAAVALITVFYGATHQLFTVFLCTVMSYGFADEAKQLEELEEIDTDSKSREHYE